MQRLSDEEFERIRKNINDPITEKTSVADLEDKKNYYLDMIDKTPDRKERALYAHGAHQMQAYINVRSKNQD